jgi:pantetheine-phosphate adenylyltransferase
MAEVVIGGTFNGLHRGHMELLEKAFSFGCPVIIGLTSDAMAKGKDVPGKIASYAARKRKLAEFLEFNGWLLRAEIFKIEDPFSGGLHPELTHIIVSPGTRENAEKINVMRKRKGLSPLRIVEVPWVLAKDGRPISGTRMRQGKIGNDGSLVRRGQKRKLPG